MADIKGNKWDNAITEYLEPNGVLYHREGGPAIIGYSDMFGGIYEVYYRMGKLHREDGPAVVYHSKKGYESQDWYLNHKKYTQEEFERITVLNRATGDHKAGELYCQL